MGLSHLVQLEKITCQLSDREVSYIYLYILLFSFFFLHVDMLLKW